MAQRFILLVPLFLAWSCASQPQDASSALAQVSVVAAAPISWPPLPTDGFVSGRGATLEDISAGRAVFALQPPGQPSPIAVPQYAIHVSESGTRTPGILIQAEGGKGFCMLGLRPLTGNTLIGGDRTEFELLGTSPPAPAPAPKPSAR